MASVEKPSVSIMDYFLTIKAFLEKGYSEVENRKQIENQPEIVF